MGRYFPVLIFLLAMAGVLLLAGLGAAGNWAGAMRYVRTWLKHVAALAIAGVLLALILEGITPRP